MHVKKKKRHLGKSFLECVAEIVLLLIFFGLGAFVLGWLGVNLETTSMNHELIILLGILIISFVLMVACFLMHFIGKIFKRKDK